MTAILGLSAFYHDSAAALLVDGDIAAAAQEERFTRKKHDPAFPTNAVRYCLAAGGLDVSDVDYVVFYEKPMVKFDRLLESYLASVPRGFPSFARALPLWMKRKLHLPTVIREELAVGRDTPVVFIDHHQSHAASAFFPSPFDEAAVLTIDGVGEWSTATIAHGRGNHIGFHSHLQFPHSLGLLYSAFTYYCGFKVNSGEYKLMGLAPYGRPLYADVIRRELIDLKADGSFRLNMRYFDYVHGLTMTSRHFDELFGGTARQPESQLLPRHFDLAASIQDVTEEIVTRMAQEAARLTRSKNLTMAGGVALNCVANSKVLQNTPFEHIWIQPASGDAGGSLGGALFVWYQLLENRREPRGRDMQKGSLLGPAFAEAQVTDALRAAALPFERFSDESTLLAEVARLLAAGSIVGWFQGRMEFGPRALGSRSILADPRSLEMQSKLNLKIKFRESFRPFAPIVPLTEASKWFDMPKGAESPYMLLVAPVVRQARTDLDEQERTVTLNGPDLIKRLQIRRSIIPAVTHIDYSARVQTVDEERNPRLLRLLHEFERQTGCDVLVNTSFNVRGEPIVCTPADALRCFSNTGMDVLVLNDSIVRKPAATAAEEQSRGSYLAQFDLD